ncbi:MAG: CopG family transcriptional regulator [Oscillospiraceae bacterium]
MSPQGRPTQDKRDKRFEIRLSEDTYNTLEECSETLHITKAEVVHKGIAMVKADIDNKKNNGNPKPTK